MRPRRWPAHRVVVMKFEYLSALEFFDEGFTYGEKHYRYDQIEAITFSATHVRHSLNAIPAGNSYDAKLELQLAGGAVMRIQQENAFWGKDQKLRMEAVWKANELLSELTFSHRLRKYEDQFAAKSFFSYGRYQFHKGGDVFLDGRLALRLNADDVGVSLQPFQICLSRHRHTMRAKLAGMFSPSDPVIDISRDRDCLLYMLRRAYGLHWPQERYRARREPPKALFLRAIVSLGAKMCSSDGEVDREELAAFRRHFRLSSDVFPEAATVFNEALTSAEGPEVTARRIRAEAANNRDLLEYILIGLATVAIADGHYHAREHAVLAAVATAFGFTQTELEHILALVGVRPPFSDGARPGRPGSASEEAYHLSVLGLSVGAARTEITAAYRKLAKQHHPDHLHACGVPTEQIRHSEEILKTINASYDWLIKRPVAA